MAPDTAPDGSGRHRRPGVPELSRLARVALVVLVAAAIAVTLVLVLRDDPAHGGPAARGHPPGSSDVGSVGRSSASVSRTLQTPVDPPSGTPEPAVPVRVSVPRLDISSALEPLGLRPDGSLAPPSRFGRAGWYDRGPRPGQVGPAVIAGHVDSVSGPAIFFALNRTRIGDLVEVRDRSGTVRRFEVTDIRRYRKTRFPTVAVYGPTPLPVLRLITCTGAFDVRKHSYVDNLVVSATLRQPRAG